MRLVIRRRSRTVLVAALLAMPALVSGQRTDSGEADRVAHLLQRTTFGVRPQDVQAVLAMGRTKWLERQLNPSQIEDRTVKQRLDGFATVSRDMTDLLVDYERQRMEQRQRQRQLNLQEMNEQQRQAVLDSIRRAEAQKMTPEERRARQMRGPQYLLGELVAAKLTRAVYSDRQLEEMMTDFWYNHFNVFFGKNLDRYFVADYERTAIRPHVFGKFRDMLEATAKHPAMLFYLDNASSVAADSMNGQAPRQRALLDQLRLLTPMEREEFLRRRNMRPQQMDRLLAQVNGQANRRRGLNENYARELMELHTLGVDGGYSQKDVIEVARAFTGWQFTRPRPRSTEEVEFVFRPQLHDRAEKWVLGQKLAAGRGMEDGEQVLDLLARHPSTAKFLARKLVERFVSDSPDPAFVNELANVFQTTDGDLRAVTRALFSSPRFYDAKYQRTKIKTPFELVASAFRVTNAEVGFSRPIMETLRSFGHLPYSEPAPTGFPAASEDWVNSGAMLNRMNFGLALAANRLEGVRIEATGKANSKPVEARVPEMLQQLMPGVNTTKLQNTILTELKKPVDITAEPANEMSTRRNARNTPNAPVREQAARALGLALGSPDFQRK